MNNYEKTFRDTLDELIEEHEINTGIRLKQRDIAKKCFISESTLSRMLDKSVPTLDVTIKLAEFFDVSCDRILGYETREKHNEEHLSTSPLTENSLRWLNKTAIENPERIEMLNEVLGHKRIADLLLDAIYVYMYARLPLFINLGSESKINPYMYFENAETMVKSGLYKNFEKVLDLTRKYYSRKIEEKSNEEIIRLMEKLKVSRNKVDEIISNFELEEKMDNLIFEQDCKEEYGTWCYVTNEIY